ncbi:MAG: BatD family protein [Candidatus Zixiibacteriota bacterium]
MIKNSGNDRLITLFLILGAVLLTGSAVASEISLTGSVDKTDIAFEDSVTLTVEIKWLGDITAYNFQVLPLPECENLKVAGTSSSISSRTSEGQGITVRTFTYVLRPTQAGIATIEPVTIDYTSLPDSTTGQLATQQFKVLIAAPVLRGNETNLPWFAKILILLAALVVIGGVILIIIIKKHSAPPEPRITPVQKFLEELGIIKKDFANDRKQFFTRLHKLLVIFLETNYGLSLSGQTTQLILKNMESVEAPAEMKEKIGQWLMHADKEKFAPGAGSPGDVIRLATEIEELFRKQMMQ